MVRQRKRLLLLPFARRQSQTTFHPVEESGFGIANGAAQLHVRWPIPPHPSLGQPGRAEAQKVGRILCGEQTLAAV